MDVYLLDRSSRSDNGDHTFIRKKINCFVGDTLQTLATKDDLAQVKYDLKKHMGEIKADTIKWMFIFWAGQAGAMLAILVLFLKK
jgi:hypothetical protein